MKKDFKLKNRKFELNSKYGIKVLDIAWTVYSRFYGSLNRKAWFSKEFDVICYAVKIGIFKASDKTEEFPIRQYMTENEVRGKLIADQKRIDDNTL